MTDAELLTVVKGDLQLLTNSNDAYLEKLLQFAKSAMQREGIEYVVGDIECEMIRCHYAAYLFRKRGGESTSMPRFLRYELNQLLFSQKTAVSEEGGNNDV